MKKPCLGRCGRKIKHGKFCVECYPASGGSHSIAMIPNFDKDILPDGKYTGSWIWNLITVNGYKHMIIEIDEENKSRVPLPVRINIHKSHMFIWIDEM